MASTSADDWFWLVGMFCRSDFFDESVTLQMRKELMSSKTKFFAYMQNHFHKKEEEMMELMRTMPIQLLLVLRNKFVPKLTFSLV